MPNKSFKAENAAVAISDPGEQLRDEHFFLDRLVVKVANVIAWTFPILMVAIVAQVTMRKMGYNQAWLDDAQWWMYGFAMVTAFAYAITTDSHVRVDIFHQSFSTTKKAKLEVFALGWLLLPFIALMVDIMTQYAWASWLAKEGSDSPNGLHRLYLLKISLPILLSIAGLASLSMIRRNLIKFTSPTFLKLIFCAFPFFLFVFDRIAYRIFYLYISFSQPDLKARKIPKEPLMEQTTITAIIALTLLIVGLWLLGRKRGEQ
jgi:TRAP-type mannitol/chloroaromatic compound transport system permease small subunit